MPSTQYRQIIEVVLLQPLVARFPLIQHQEVSPEIVEIICKNNGNLSFKAGQYITVTIDDLQYPDPKGKTRVFNLVSSPNNTEYLGFSFLQSNSGFKKTLAELPLNSELEIRGPFGVFTLPDISNKPIILVSDGIGVTPCVSIALYAAEESLPHKITMLYTSQRSFPYLNNLQDVQKENKNFTLLTKTGLIDTNFIKKSVSNIKNSLWFVSGAPKSIQHMVKTICKLGVFEKDIKTEEFSGY